MQKNKTGQLCYWLIRQPEGREFLDHFKLMFANEMTLPKDPNHLAQYGGTESYLSYKAGMAAFIRVVEIHAQGFIDQENAAVAAKNKQDAQQSKREKRK